MTELDYCLFPVSTKTFLEEYWEKKPLLVKRYDKNYFSELLTLEKIDNYLTTHGLQFPDFQLVKNGEWLTSDTKGIRKRYSIATKFADITYFLDSYSEGATIIFLALQRHLISISKFCWGLQKVLNIPIQANVYLTPKSSKGFRAHFDTHDVFILQVEGKKRWKIWDSEIDLPLKHQQYLFDDNQEMKTPSMEFVLEKGDTLYLPRGVIHSGSSLQENSMHITVGIFPFVFVNLLSQEINRILDELENDISFQKPLPPQFVFNNYFFSSEIKEYFNFLLKKIYSNINFEQTMQNGFKLFLEKQRPNLLHIFNNFSKLHTIDSKTVIYKKPNVSFLLAKDTKTALLVNGNKIELPLQYYDLIVNLLKKDSFCLYDIGDRLTNDEKIELTYNLIKIGFYTLEIDNK